MTKTDFTHKVVPGILLIPTTVLSLILTGVFMLLAGVGAPLLALLGVLTMVWAANTVMWCVLLRPRNEEQAGSIRPTSNRWRHYLALGACLALIGYGFTAPGGAAWQSMALAWVGLTLVYFLALVYWAAPATADVLT